MDTVSVRKKSGRERSVLILLQRITTNLCLGPSLSTIHSPIGSGLIWMSTIQQPAVSLAPSTTMADSDICVGVRIINHQKAASARQGNCPIVLVHDCSGMLSLQALKQGLDEAHCPTVCGNRR